MESEKSKSQWLPCERFDWNACAGGDSLECVVRLDFWLRDISPRSARCVMTMAMTMTMTMTAASQPTDELHKVSCVLSATSKVETKAIPYRSILTSDESWIAVQCLWRAR